MRISTATSTCTAALLVASLAGCGPPLRVDTVAPDTFYREQIHSTLSSDELSDATRIALRRHSLLENYEDDPEATVGRLLDSWRAGSGGANELFAMAELSLWQAERDDDTRNYLAAAVYAFAFLFPEEEGALADPFDPRTRLAADIYNRALAKAMLDDDKKFVAPRSGTFAMPHGDIRVAFDEADLDWHGYRLTDFTPVGELKIEGIRNRYRRPGLGAPLAAHPVPPDGEYKADDLVGPNNRVPIAAILRLDGPREQLRSKAPLEAELVLYASTDEEQVRIEDRVVPLEAEPTVVLASTLYASRVWETELAAFLGNALSVKTRPTLLRALHPYERGKIPVIFVHGTASSVFRWTDMVNDLTSDPEIRKRFQFWFYTYDSGNPIAYSAYHLRRLLELQVAECDPDGTDEALRRMVVIGHSQGGLITKMTAIDSGSRFWDGISRKPFDEVKLKPEVRELLADALFVEPLPFVERVIFISTPHRGSYLAGPQLVRRLAQRLIRMPRDVVGVGVAMSGLSSSGDTYLTLQRMPTSIDNMSPGNPFIRTLSRIPLDPRVKAHSIIPVTDMADIENGEDGVVKYQSAHIDGVESELVVHDSHSTQGNPITIEEVRRILHLHLQAP
jgi:pimeloyl-ACP methyl ester carboxylesterase